MKEQSQQQNELQARYNKFKEAGLKLDLTRGKPASEQLDLANDLDGILAGFYLLQDGTDVRNYGGILGIPEARQLGSELLEMPIENVMVGGNSSLNLMYLYISYMLPKWRAENDTVIKFLCPVPGYDRHFTICNHFNIEMINIPLLEHGPDMDMIEQLISEDPTIKAIWCVPKDSKPTGHTYGDDTVARFASLGLIAGPDFKIFWDNAYLVHDLTETSAKLANLFTAAQAKGCEDSVLTFASTSKITFAGAGISFFGTSSGELKAFEKFLSSQMIGFDKVNQLRHLRFLEDREGILVHMARHRELLAPKFTLVEEKLSGSLAGIEIDSQPLATWTTPLGGYFVSLDTLPGLASQVVELAGAVGVKLTPAGATYPNGKDPADSNIRIAPSYPTMLELGQAMDVLVTCLQLASITRSSQT